MGRRPRLIAPWGTSGAIRTQLPPSSQRVIRCSRPACQHTQVENAAQQPQLDRLAMVAEHLRAETKAPLGNLILLADLVACDEGKARGLPKAGDQAPVNGTAPWI